MTELARAFNRGPGVIVIRNAITRAVLDRANVEFDALIDAQNASGAAAGDYFVKAGANDRVWNALEKLAVDAPEVFVSYYASDAIALASTAWLGPGYQITSQLNQVRPGGTAQRAHRDYPLGFTTAAQAATYPVHVHSFGPMLTLQGAIAHRDMAVESGPTKYLPHSHKLHSGYVAWHQPSVRDRFEERFVQLPLGAGGGCYRAPERITVGNYLLASAPPNREPIRSLDRAPPLVHADLVPLERDRDHHGQPSQCSESTSCHRFAGGGDHRQCHLALRRADVTRAGRG